MPRMGLAVSGVAMVLSLGCGGSTRLTSSSTGSGSHGAASGTTASHVIGSTAGAGSGSSGHGSGSAGSRGSTSSGSGSHGASSGTTGSGSTSGSSGGLTATTGTTGAPDATQHQALPAAERMGSPGHTLEVRLAPGARPPLSSPHYKLQLGVTPPSAP